MLRRFLRGPAPRTRSAVFGAAVVLVSVFAASPAADAGSAGEAAARVRLVSVSRTGGQANGDSVVAGVSAHGRVAFTSTASNLVRNDTNGVMDVFVRDPHAGKTTRVSVSSRGAQANGSSSAGAISANGRYVVFSSVASNLVPGDTNGWLDVFVHDLQTRKTTLVSVGRGGTQGDFHSWGGTISADGGRVAFISDASNLVRGDTNRVMDIFVRDLRAGTTVRANVTGTGGQANDFALAPAISADGRHVAFLSDASELVPVDTNGWGDAFVRNLRARTTTLVTVSTAGEQGIGYLGSRVGISGTGRYVAFGSSATNMAPGGSPCCANRIYLRDLSARTTDQVSVSSDGTEANSDSFDPAISDSGRYVAFHSTATNLTPGEDTNNATDVFIHDVHTGVTRRVSMAPGGRQPDGISFGPAVSADGRYVAFNSFATNLVPGDTNNERDTFLYIQPKRGSA